MTHTYNITRMSCDGCGSKIIKKRNEIVAVIALNPPLPLYNVKK